MIYQLDYAMDDIKKLIKEIEFKVKQGNDKHYIYSSLKNELKVIVYEMERHIELRQATEKNLTGHARPN